MSYEEEEEEQLVDNAKLIMEYGTKGQISALRSLVNHIIRKIFGDGPIPPPEPDTEVLDEDNYLV